MRVTWRGLELPTRVERDTSISSDTYGKFYIEPFERGFGTTIGNSLRRVLLSSLEGYAITSDSKLTESSSLTIKVKTVEHGDGTVKTLNLENEYLPVVVACENGAAPSESMKAQAVASRTFAMYKINHPRGSNFDVWDNESDQVYNPSKTVTDKHRQSVTDTTGIVLRYTGKIICAFYVSGSGSTAKYVTYKEGKSGDDITQTTLVWCTDPPSKNPYNRDCMGQVQANDLDSEKGYNYQQILRYFYGDDIEGLQFLEVTPTGFFYPTCLPPTASKWWPTDKRYYEYGYDGARTYYK